MMSIRPGEMIAEYRKWQYAENDKTVKRIMECIDGLTLEDVDRVLGFLKQALHRRVKVTLPLADE